MQKIILIVLLNTCVVAFGQKTSSWSEADRKYLLDNLTRSRDQLVKETQGLSEKQWNFKESPDRWSIKEIVEHIDIWELLLAHQVSRTYSAGPQPELAKASMPDSIYFNFIMEDKPHISVEYTKPFTYTLPMGLNDGGNNVTWFLKMRNESIEFLRTTKDDMRLYFSNKSIHQIYISVFGHTDRHLRQIQKVKNHPNYPK